MTDKSSDTKGRIRGKKVLFFITIAIVAIVFFGTIVMLLWNYVLAQVLNISTITFGQALGILLLSKILFGGWRWGWGGGSHHWKNRMQQKWAAMTPEEREKFKEQWRRRCGPWGAQFKKPDSRDTSNSSNSDLS